MPEFENAKSINTRITGSTRHWQASSVFTKHPALMGVIASQLAHALEGATIDYLTAEVSESTGYVDVLVFAGERIVWTRSTEDDGLPSTRIVNIDQIESVELMHVPNLLSGSWGASDRLTVVVAIDGTDFTLPADDGATSANVAQLGAYLPALLSRFAPVS